MPVIINALQTQQLALARVFFLSALVLALTPRGFRTAFKCLSVPPRTAEKSRLSTLLRLLDWRWITKICLVICALSLTVSSYGFKPLENGALMGKAKPEDQSHESITRIALNSLFNEFFPAERIDDTIEEAFAQITHANGRVDVTDVCNDASHFDNESFSQGQDLLLQLRDKIISALKVRDGKMARESLGQALHTLQDFYSHSNWIERGGGINSALGRDGPGIVGVTSGYFEFGRLGVGLCPGTAPSYPPGKFKHGGPWDLTPDPSGGLNKDSSDETESPHHQYHLEAASAAVGGTKQFIRDIKELLNDDIRFGALFGLDRIYIRNNNNTSTITMRINLIQGKDRVVLADRVIPPHQTNSFPLKNFANWPASGQLEVRGLDSVPSPTGLAGYTIFFPPVLKYTKVETDRELENISSGAHRYNIYSVQKLSRPSTDTAGSEHSDLFVLKPVDVIVPPIIFPPIFPPFLPPIIPFSVASALRASSATAETQRADAADSTPNYLVSASGPSLGRTVELLSIADTLPNSSTASYKLDVDSTVRTLRVDLSGSLQLQVSNPAGGQMPDITAGNEGFFYQIGAPPPGKWTITVQGQGAFRLAVRGEAEIYLSDFAFVELSGRPGHQGFFPIAGEILAGQPNFVRGTVVGSTGNVVFECRDFTGQLLRSFAAVQDENNKSSIAGHLAPSSERFLLYVRGEDGQGLPFQRLLPRKQDPSTLRVRALDNPGLARGNTTRLTFTVQNLGAPGLVYLTVTNSLGFSGRVSPARLELSDTNEALVVAEITTPIDAILGMGNEIKVTAQRPDGSDSNEAELLAGISAAKTEPGAALEISRDGNGVQLRWKTNETVQVSTELKGTWIDLPAGTTNAYFDTNLAKRKFYRLKPIP